MAGNRRKFGKDKLFTKINHAATSGVIGDAEYQVHGENALRVATTFTSSGTLTIQGRIENSDTWDALGTLTSGGDTDEIDIGSYDYVRFNFTVAAGSTGEIAASGFFKGSSAGGGGATNSFSIMQTDAGTSPTADSATDTLTLTSSDASVTVTGNSTTDTIDLIIATSNGANTFYADSNASASGDGSLLAPYTSLQAAIDAAESLGDSERKTIIVAADSAFDEDITISGGVLAIIGLGPFNIGDDAQTYKDSTTARNVLWETGDTTLPLSLRPSLVIGVIGQGNATSTHPAVTTACKISGNFTIDKGVATPAVAELWMQNVKVKGNMAKGASIASTQANMYLEGCFFDGTFVMGINAVIVSAKNCEFDGLLDINSYNYINSCEISGGITLAASSPVSYIKPTGIYNSTISGTITGVSGSDILVDTSTNYKMIVNSVALAGAGPATKTVMSDLVGSASTPVASSMSTNTVKYYIDESANTLNFKLKYSDGSIKRAKLPLYDAPDWATAKQYTLDNVDDYFESPTTTGESLGISGSTAFSINIIVNFDMSATDTCIMFSLFAGTGTGKVEMTWLNSQFRFQVDGAYTIASPTRSDKDYHICLVYDGALGTDIARAKIYVDGSDATASASGTIPSVVNTEIADSILGLFSRTGIPANYFNGSVKEVSIYNKALSSAEVTSLYNSGSYSDPTAISGCRSSWWFGDNTSDNLVKVVDNVGDNDLDCKNLDDGVITSV